MQKNLSIGTISTEDTAFMQKNLSIGAISTEDIAFMQKNSSTSTLIAHREGTAFIQSTYMKNEVLGPIVGIYFVYVENGNIGTISIEDSAFMQWVMQQKYTAFMQQISRLILIF